MQSITPICRLAERVLAGDPTVLLHFFGPPPARSVCSNVTSPKHLISKVTSLGPEQTRVDLCIL